MAKPQLLYGAFDTSPSNYGLDIISEAQRKKNWGVCYVGNNPEVDVGLVFKVKPDYFVVGGPSAFNNSFDKVMLAASTIGIKPTYVLGDTPRSILRPGVRRDVGHATAIVALPSDVSLAKEFGYKDAIHLGYPSHWGADTAKVRPSRVFDGYTGMRVFVCGLKHAEITDTMLASVINAMDQISGSWWRIYFQAHPSEIKETQDSARREELIAHKCVVTLQTRENVASLMMAADCTVCTGEATGILEGALLRFRIVYYLNDQVKEYMKNQVNEEIWGPVAAGACEIAANDSMSQVLNALFDRTDPAHDVLRTKQEVAFPHQPVGLNVAQEVLNYIENPHGYMPFSERQIK